jgi:O-antigen/teichoic acid export membrane protein
MIRDHLGFARGTASTGDSRQIIANTLSAWAGAATSGLIGFFLVPLLLLRVGKEGYGLTTLVGTVVGLTVLVDLGLRGALGRHLTEHVAKRDERAFNELASSALLVYLLMAAVCAGVCVAFAGPMVRAFRVPDELAPAGVFLIRWYSSSMIVLGFVSPVFSGTIMALGRYDLLNIVGALVAMIRGAGLVVAVWFLKGGLYGWAIVSLCACALGVMGNAAVAFRQWPSLRLCAGLIRTRALRPLFSLGGSLFTIQATMVVSTQSDPIVLTAFLGPAAVALYSPALSLVSLFRPVISALSDQLSPFATVHHVMGHRARLQGLLIRGTRLTLLMGMLAFVLLGIFASPIMRVWLARPLGAEYSIVASVLTIWAVTDLGMYAIGTQWAVLLAMTRLSLIVRVSVILAAANVLLSIYLVGYTRLGVVGVVIPTALQRLVTWLIITPYTARLSGLTLREYFVASHAPPLVVGALLSGAAFALRAVLPPGNAIELLTDCGLIALIWVGLSWQFGLTSEERSACLTWTRNGCRIAREAVVPIG